MRLRARVDDGVHLLGIDRFGVLVRVECPRSHDDLRVPFPTAVADRPAPGAAPADLLRCARA